MDIRPHLLKTVVLSVIRGQFKLSGQPDFPMLTTYKSNRGHLNYGVSWGLSSKAEVKRSKRDTDPDSLVRLYKHSQSNESLYNKVLETI